MERRGVPAPRTNDLGFSAFAPSAPGHAHGPSSPGATGGTSGLGAAAAAIADIERQLERLIAQRKTERLAAARAIGENGNNDQRKKAKTGAATHEEDKDSSSTESAASDAQSTKRRNLDEDLLIGMLGIPFVSSEVARGRSPHSHSSPTMPTSPPMTPAPATHHTSLTPDMAANAADLVLRADLGQGDPYRDTPPAIATESVWQAAEAAHKPPSPPLRSFTSAPAPPLPEQQLQPVVAAAALRREIMGEVKTELLMEVARRDKENQGKLYELELENRELKQELHGLLREMREDRRRKEREREERKKRRQRSAGQRTKRGRDGSDDSEGSDMESSDDDTISSSSSSNQDVTEPKRRGTKRSRGSSDREPADRHSDKSDTNSSKRKRGKASVAPARKAERHAGEGAADEADVQQRRAQTTEPAVPHVMMPLRADTRGSPQPRADRWSHSSGSGGEETTAAATGPDEDRNADDGSTPSRSTMWRRKKGHRAAEEIEHDNQERWQMRVDQLRAFAKEHGHCRVPKNHPNRPLYTWTQNVRQRWRRGAVPESKIRDLVALGMQHPTDELGGAAARRSPLQRPPVEPTTEEDVDTSRDQDSKVVDRKSSTSTGRPRAVKRSRREKRLPSATTKAEGGEAVKRPQQSRASDDDYAALSEKDHDDDEEEEKEEEEEEEREEKYTQRLRQRQPRRSEEAKPHTNAVDGVVTRRRAKSLTSQAEEKEPARGEKRKPTTTGSSTDADKETKSPKKKAKLAERKSEGEDAKKQQKKPSIDESEEDESATRSDYEDDEEGAGSEGDEIPESHVNHKWLQHFEELKAWQKQHNLSRPNRKQSASLGRWSDEQLNRMRSGMLLPWRRKLLDATGFFASTTESS